MRFGLIGAGWAGALRADAIARLPHSCLAAIADQDLLRARSLAERSGAGLEADWQTLIRRSDIDVVLVSTPPALHAEMCTAALAQGKHVVCEKPLARTPAECQRILDAAEQHKRVLATGFNYRFYPAIVKARQLLDTGAIGELDHIRSYAGHPGGSEFTHPWVSDVNAVGGGALMDNGIHIVDLTRYFLGEVAEVKGFATGHVWQFPGCEDNGFALLRNPAGKVATLQASWSEWRGYRFSIEIYGTQGCIRASYPPMLTTLTTLTTRTQVIPAESRPRRRRRIFMFPVYQLVERLRSYRWTAIKSFQHELEALERTIAGEKTPLALGRDGLRAVEIAHAVYQTSEPKQTSGVYKISHES